jgi:hypothetical protein
MQLDRYMGVKVTGLKIKRRDIWLHMQHIDQNCDKTVLVVMRGCAQLRDEAI